MSEPDVSLIIATRNRRASLEVQLGQLARVSPALNWELVIVDNGSTDGTAQWLAGRRFPKPLTVLSEPRPGKSRALNLGIGAAVGALLVFTDDDVRPETSWLDRLADAARRHPAAYVFGGRIVPVYETVPEWIRRSQNLQEMLLSEHDLGEAECAYPAYRYPIGPNMAVRASRVAARAARWPEDRGPGTRVPLGDERAFLEGVSMPTDADRIYVPDAVVHHTPEPEQLSVSAATARCFQGGYVAGCLDAAAARPAAVGAEAGRRAARRLQVSSTAELICVLSRAAGVAAGRLARIARARPAGS